MRQVKELLAQMRNAYLKLKQDSHNILQAEAALAAEGATTSEKDAFRQTMRDEAGVGEVQE